MRKTLSQNTPDSVALKGHGNEADLQNFKQLNQPFKDQFGTKEARNALY
jgi:hypothetical protein